MLKREERAKPACRFILDRITGVNIKTPVHSEGDQPGISLEGMILKLKLQYFGHLMGRVDSLEMTLRLEGLGAGGEGDNRG